MDNKSWNNSLALYLASTSPRLKFIVFAQHRKKFIFHPDKKILQSQALSLALHPNEPQMERKSFKFFIDSASLWRDRESDCFSVSIEQTLFSLRPLWDVNHCSESARRLKHRIEAVEWVVNRKLSQFNFTLFSSFIKSLFEAKRLFLTRLKLFFCILFWFAAEKAPPKMCWRKLTARSSYLYTPNLIWMRNMWDTRIAFTMTHLTSIVVRNGDVAGARRGSLFRSRRAPLESEKRLIFHFVIIKGKIQERSLRTFDFEFHERKLRTWVHRSL